MESEHQPYVVGYCRNEDCCAELWFGDDIRFPEWRGGDPDCLHECEDSIDMLAKYKW